jgi:DNA processing protein
MNKGTTCTLPIHTIQSKAEDFPDILRHIPDPPDMLFIKSTNWPDLLQRPWVAIVGSRKVTSYGRAVTAQLAGDLAASGLVIVSGLAIGVDGIAHQATLQAGGLTVAVLAGGLDRIHPGSHQQLAGQILSQGGALISEYPIGIPSYPQHFVARNRLVSGLSQAIVITEAAEKSGTLHTARFALEQGREVFAVPGNITSRTSAATNSLIKSGASPVTSSRDILQSLGLAPVQKVLPKGNNPAEQCLLELLASGEIEGAVLLAKTGLGASVFNQTLTMLEITGKVRSLGGNRWTIG